MTPRSFYVRSACSLALIAGIAVLSGCGPAPYSHTSTSEQTTTTTPAPPIVTSTTTTEQSSHHE